MDAIDIFVFGSAGDYDDLNPYKIFKDKRIQDIVLTLAKKQGYTYDLLSLSNELSIAVGTLDQIVDHLIKANLIVSKQEKFSLNFPFFIDGDIKIIERFSKKVVVQIGDVLLKNEEKLKHLLSQYDFKVNDVNRLLYHLIGDKTFDGLALDYFAKKDLFAISKVQPLGRDYIVVGYEKSEQVEYFSKKMLCSSNNYFTEDVIFNSFGDSFGDRKDFYRYFRLVQANPKNIDAINKSFNFEFSSFEEKQMSELAASILKVLNQEPLTSREFENLDILRQFDYIELKEDKVIFKVPVISFDCVKEIANEVLSLIEEEVSTIFSNFEHKLKGLSALSHQATLKEIGNEMWHQVFGEINSYLIQEGLFLEPHFTESEGRYLRALYLK